MPVRVRRCARVRQRVRVRVRVHVPVRVRVRVRMRVRVLVRERVRERVRWVERVRVRQRVRARLQEAELRSRPDVVVATPGRLIDLLRNAPSVGLDEVEILVRAQACERERVGEWVSG
eukprot:3545052-Pleurochrysis_carterae.AAC.1